MKLIFFPLFSSASNFCSSFACTNSYGSELSQFHVLPRLKYLTSLVVSGMVTESRTVDIIAPPDELELSRAATQTSVSNPYTSVIRILHAVLGTFSCTETCVVVTREACWSRTKSIFLPLLSFASNSFSSLGFTNSYGSELSQPRVGRIMLYYLPIMLFLYAQNSTDYALNYASNLPIMLKLCPLFLEETNLRSNN